MGIAMADAEIDRATEAERRRREGRRDEAAILFAQPVDVIARALEAFAGQDAAEAQRKREVMRQVEKEYGI